MLDHSLDKRNGMPPLKESAMHPLLGSFQQHHTQLPSCLNHPTVSSFLANSDSPMQLSLASAVPQTLSALPQRLQNHILWVKFIKFMDLLQADFHSHYMAFPEGHSTGSSLVTSTESHWPAILPYDVRFHSHCATFCWAFTLLDNDLFIMDLDAITIKAPAHSCLMCTVFNHKIV